MNGNQLQCVDCDILNIFYLAELRIRPIVDKKKVIVFCFSNGIVYVVGVDLNVLGVSKISLYEPSWIYPNNRVYFR